MKVLYVFATLLAVVFAAAEDACYKETVSACKSFGKNLNDPKKCNAKYGAIEGVLPDLQEYVNAHIIRNFEYMLMSTHYGNYEKNREGFEKLFMDLSDSKWDKAIDLIKYITKRGGEMKFGRYKDVDNEENGGYELYEINSLAKALDIEKSMANSAFHIHGEATRRREEYHDPEVSSYIENEFIHKQSKTIRQLSGHVSDLNQLLNGPDSSLALFIFDEYLKKQSIV
ncbi:hypothetical protein FQR65_LT11848 [Abscondita terminalis]|nr:hypothetical protein FQR65_LT11848 [Abscondita terminalis]